MGESRTSCGLSLGRSAALGLACVALLGSGAASAQAKSPTPDKSGAKALGGTIVQYEESAGRGILYHEAVGGLVTNAPPSPVPDKTNGESAGPKAATAKATAPKAAPTTGATPPPRAPQRQAAPAEGVAMRR